MKKKINLRLVIIAIIAVIATVIGSTTIYYGILQQQIKNDLYVCAELLKDTNYFESVDIDVDDIDLSTDIERLRVTWVDSDGTVLYDNDATASTLANHMDRPEIKEAFEEGEGSSVRHSDTMNKDTFYYAVLLDNGTVLRVATEAESVWYVVFSSLPMIILILAIIIILCVALSHMLTKQLITPIEVMAENIEDTSVETPYKELVPFANMIRKQHTDILAAAKSRQDFTANVSHELKTPLTAISGYAELMSISMEQKAKNLAGEAAEENLQNLHFAKEIRKSADRLLSLINDIIRLSELDRAEDAPGFEIVDLYDLVKENMEALSVNASNRKVKLNFSGEHCKIRGNVNMLNELVENLVQNAIRYNNEGGNVWVSVIAVPEAKLVVKDDGIGIPVADQTHVFERFYRVDKSRSKATGGTGLGLAIVKHIVELHDAKIKLTSEVDKGTTIEVVF